MDETLPAIATGWVAMGLVVIAAVVPLGYRLWRRRRPAPRSPTISWHVIVGIGTALAAFVHAVVGVTSMGSERSIAAGNLPFAAGAAAVLVLMAHVGIGLQLRDPKLKLRPQLRRRHVITAITIGAFTLIHAVLLWTADA